MKTNLTINLFDRRNMLFTVDHLVAYSSRHRNEATGGKALRMIHSIFKIKMADVDHWIEIAKECKYLPENDLKVIDSDKNLFIHFQRALSF